MWWCFTVCGKGGAQAQSDFVYTPKMFLETNPLSTFAIFTPANLKPCEFRICFENQ